MSEKQNLPKNWKRIAIGDYFITVTGNTPPKNDKSNYGEDILFIKPPHLTDRLVFSTEEKLSSKGSKLARILPPESILISCIGNLGKIGFNSVEVAFNQQINAIRASKELNNKLLFYQALSLEFKTQLENLSSATTISIVNKSKFDTITLMIPPLDEQHRIVSKIEELFSELDNGVANLKRAQNQLKVYRQTLLKYAFEGKLTEQWRKENNPEPAEKLLERIKEERQNRYEQEIKEWKASVKIWEQEGKMGRKPRKPKISIEIDYTIRDNKLSIKVEDSSTHIVDCLHSTPKFQNTGKYCVDTTCILDGKILWDKIRFVSEESFKERISRLKPEKGDILFAREGTVGTTLVLNNKEDICLGQRMMMFRPYSYILSKYFMYYFQSIEFKKQYIPLIGGTTAPHLNIGVIKKLIFPVCSKDEQQKIIDELEDRTSLIDNLEKTIESALQKSEALRQSILKKAFEGKLVPQDPNDEPASELLKRIQAEKAKYLEEQKQKKKKKANKKLAKA